MADEDRRKLRWRNKKANHGRKPNLGRRKGKVWKAMTGK